MLLPSNSPTGRDFARVTADLALLDADQARTLAELATQRNVAPSQLALQQGLLSAAQVDIVETLLHPLDTVPGYEILDVIGQGGMGVVFRARQSNLDRVVALKTVLVNRMSDPGALARFEQEAVAVARLHHPHIVAAYDFGRHAGRLYFAMEWLEGEDAERLIQRRGSLDEATAWGLARQAAAGLAHAEEMGIVHRDIKPANLLLVLAPAGYALPPSLPMVKIADFGLAFLTRQNEQQTRLTADGSAVGSPHYLAPEQLRDEPVDFRADMYALGASVFHMLAGRPPFADKHFTQIIAAKLAAAVPNLQTARPGVSAATAELVARMMARDPAERPANYLRLLEEIDTLLPSASRWPSSIASPNLAETTTLVFNRDATLPLGQTRDPRALPGRFGSKRIAISACAALLVIVAGFAAWRALRPTAPPPNPPRRELVETGWEQPLFEGKSLSVWRNLTGVWKLDKDDEGGLVLSGEHGTLPYELPSVATDRRQPPDHYRITLHVQLHRATQAEVRFAYAPDASEFLALRITPDTIQLRRSDNAGPWKPLPNTDATDVVNRYHVVQIERQHDAWWVLWDEDVIAAVPFAGQEHRPEFRLVVESGPAWFSDVLLEEIASPEPLPARP